MEKKVEVLLSVYRPDESYLRKQLDSLHSQTYKNLSVLIYDDCVEERCNPEIFKEHLKEVEWKMLPYQERNLGYVKAFETLTKESTADYIAFCDQDDIWMEDKIEKCINELERSKTLLVATERMIIDENDRIIIERAREVYKKPCDQWKSFDNIGKYNVFITYAVGMSMVLDGEFARNIVPFSLYAAHDNWAIICACAQGSVSFIDEPLVKYRRHENNVSGVLKGIYTKEDYMKERVIPHSKMIQDFKNKYPDNKDIPELEAFSNARLRHKIKDIYKYRYLSEDVAKFDIVVALIPKFLFYTFVKFVQKISK